MKKKFIITLLSATAVTLAASAEGYQVNTLSARQNGMGHVGTAMKLGSESMIFNPAGLAFMNDRVDFRGTFTAIMPKCSATIPDGKTYHNASTVATPLSANIGMRIYENMAAGVSFYTPYGSNIDWTDNWPGAELNQRVKLSVFTVQPTVSWRPIKNLSIGAGLMVAWGSVDLSKGLVSGQSLDALLALLQNSYRFDNTVPASVQLKGESDVAVGVNIGAMWDINDQWTVGTSWRSQMKMKVSAGTASVDYANEVARTILEQRLGLIHQANFSASMPAAWVWNIGVAYKPTDRWVVSADAQLTGWGAYKVLDIDFLDDKLADYDQHIVKDYKNAWTIKMGAQYSVTKRLDVRAGLMIDMTPVNDHHYNPETPGMTKVAPSVGLSFSPLPNFSIDASLLYVQGVSRDGDCTYTDLLLNQERTFSAHYKVHAWAPSIGVSFRF